MMSVFEGDEWKHTPEPVFGGTSARELRGPRAERQARVDAAYATAQISLARWHQLTNLLSDPVEWEKANRL